MTFSSNTYEHHGLAYCKPSANRQAVGFFIDNKSVTEEAFKSFVDKQNRKKDVVWYEFSPKSIETVLSGH